MFSLQVVWNNWIIWVPKCGHHHPHHHDCHHHDDCQLKDAGLEVCSACKFRESGYSSPCTAAYILIMMMTMMADLSMKMIMIDHDYDEDDDDNFVGGVDDILKHH